MKRKKWTYEALQEEALKYQTKQAFRKNSYPAYLACKRRGILNSICKHTKSRYHYWTDEELQKEALKYNARNEFEKNSEAAYCAATRRKLLNKICKHMKRPSLSSEEKELFDTISKNFKKVEKLRVSKIKIKNKPHIKGFEIDIYLPEFKKGIEFDGTYTHSVAGLKRGRPSWPESDLKNYHKIKDRYFKKIGIDILHIKEDNWIKNKEKCIKKCFDFLLRSYNDHEE